jgi:LysM repeat protein
MKMKPCFASLLAVLVASAPLLSAGEVERLRALVAEQEMQIQQLELKVAQLTSSPAPVSTTAPSTDVPTASKLTTKADVPKPPSEEGLIPIAETCPEPATTESSESPATYTVQAGDNMAKIARKHATTSAILNELNGLKKDAIIRIGQKLKLPSSADIASAPAEPDPATVAEPEPAVTPEPISVTETVATTETAVSEPTLALDEPSASTVKHTVADKETFYSIAKKHNVTIKALVKENPSINPNTLRIGQIVQIPGKPKTTELTSTPEPEQSLTLSSQRNVPISSQSASTVSESRAADKPIKITREISYSDFAKKYNTTTARLDQLNGLRLDPTTILAQGSELYIPEQR